MHHAQLPEAYPRFFKAFGQQGIGKIETDKYLDITIEMYFFFSATVS